MREEDYISKVNETFNEKFASMLQENFVIPITVKKSNGEKEIRKYKGFVISEKDLAGAQNGDTEYTGVYIFFAKTKVGGKDRTEIYIGESKNLGLRIQEGQHDHVKGLDEKHRTKTVVIASDGFKMSPQQRYYVEARIFEMANKSGIYDVLTQRVNSSRSPEGKKNELERLLKKLAAKLESLKLPVYTYLEPDDEKKTIRTSVYSCVPLPEAAGYR